MAEIPIKALIPHRGRMMLPEKIVEAGSDAAVTHATAGNLWPLAENDGINPLILIELVAQTAAICIGWDDYVKTGGLISGKGWLVGIKKADFFMNTIPLKSLIITRVQKNFSAENLTEIRGESHIGNKSAGKIILQIVRSE